MIKIFDKDHYESIYILYYLDNKIEYHTKNDQCECFLVNKNIHLYVYNFKIEIIDILLNKNENYNYYLYI